MNTTAVLASDTPALGGAFSAERWIYAGEMTLLGILMVFSVLAILWLVLSLFSYIGSKKKEEKAERKSEPAPAPTPVREEPKAMDDAALVAVLTAAVAAYMADNAEEAPKGGFRVVSFRRVHDGHAWNKS